MGHDPVGLEEEEYRRIYSRVPRLTVELVLRNLSGKVYMTLRADGPCQGLWHLPGGTVRFGESLLSAVRRVGREELSIEVGDVAPSGVIEYPSHYLRGLDSPVGIAFQVTGFRGQPQVGRGASAGGWFASLPRPMHEDQDRFLVDRGLVLP